MTGFFTGGGVSLSFGNPQDPAAFPTFGNRWRGGQILEEGTVGPQTDINTNQPLTGPDGKVKEQLALPLLCDGSGPAAEAGMRTDERNPNDHTDTGRRVAYIKGALRFAIGDALRKAGAADLEVGGYLFMMWTGMGKTGNSKFIGRLWQVHYIRPTAAFLAQQQVPQGGYPQGAFPPHTAHAEPGVGAMPTQNGAPQHTGFAPTSTPVTAPPQQGWTAAPSAPVAPPNPYGQHNPPGSPAANAAQQWAAQQGVGHPQAPIQTVGQMQNPAGSGAFRPDDNGWQQPQGTGAQFETPAAAQAWGAQTPQSAAPAGNPWGQAPDTQQPPQTPYGPPGGQGAPVPPPAGNPWQQ